MKLKQDKKYPWMYYFKYSNGRYSKDYYNLTRAAEYYITYNNIDVGTSVVGRLPYSK